MKNNNENENYGNVGVHTVDHLIESLLAAKAAGMPGNTIIKAYDADSQEYVEYQGFIYSPNEKEIIIQTID